MLGVSLDPTNPAGRPNVRALRPLTWARLIARPGPTVARYAARLHLAGIETALVLARESFGTAPVQDWPLMAKIHVRTCRPTALVIGNEPDAYLLPEPSPSSWAMEPDAYVHLVTTVLEALEDTHPRPLMVGAGSVSGDPEWWQAVRPYWKLNLDGLNIHPYGKDPEETRELLSAYACFHLPLYVLEWNRPAHEIPAYVRMLQDERIRAACYFCWSDAMVPGFGLLDARGRPTPELAALKLAALGVPA